MQAGKHRNNAGRQACQTSSAEAISTLAWGSVVRILLRLRQARWERCNAEVVQAVFA